MNKTNQELMTFYSQKHDEIVKKIANNTDSAGEFMHQFNNFVDTLVVEVLCFACALRKKSHVATIYNDLTKIATRPLEIVISSPELLYEIQKLFPSLDHDKSALHEIVALLNDIKEQRSNPS